MITEQAWTEERQAAAQARCEALVSGEPGLQFLCNRTIVDTRWDDSALLLALRQALIAALTDLPAALAELSRLQADNARLRAVVEAARVMFVGFMRDPEEAEGMMELGIALSECLGPGWARDGGQP